MEPRHKFAFALILASFCLLVPGIFQPIFSISLTTNIDAGIAKVDGKVLDQSRSILGTVADLYKSDRNLVATLIFCFSVVVPVLKGVLLIMVLLSKNFQLQKKFFGFVQAIGKWSMADVFVVAISLVFLATDQDQQASHHQVSFMGMKLGVKITTDMVSSLGPGFYYFLSYCILSLGTLHLIRLKPSESK